MVGLWHWITKVYHKIVIPIHFANWTTNMCVCDDQDGQETELMNGRGKQPGPLRMGLHMSPWKPSKPWMIR